MIADLKREIDLAHIVMGAGVDLIQRGNRHVGLCPFHTEKTPSFFIFPDNRFKCFGCSASGDCIDFVMKYYNLSFKEALKFLGIEQGPITPGVRKEIERRKHQAELIRQFRDWEQRYCSYISDLWHKTKRLMMNGIPPDDLELYAHLLHMSPIWRHKIDILIYGTDKDKFKLYKEAQRCRKKTFLI